MTLFYNTKVFFNFQNSTQSRIFMLVSRISYLATSLTLIASLTLSSASAAPNFTVDPKDRITENGQKGPWLDPNRPPSDFSEIGDVFKRETDFSSWFSHLGIYVGGGKIFEMSNDTVARQWRAAGRPTHFNLLETTPTRFESSAPLEGIRALAATGDRLVEKVAALSAAREAMLAGATFTNLPSFTSARVGATSCRTVVVRSPRAGVAAVTSVICTTQVTVGEYRCETFVADVLDRATNSTTFSSVLRSPTLVFNRIPFRKWN
jgi:hypothetical protein